MTPTRIVVFAVLFMPLALQVGAFFIRFLMFFGGAFLAALPDDTLQPLARRVPDGLAITLYLASTALFAQLLDYTYFIPVFVVTTFFVVLKVTHGEGVLRRLFAWTPLRYLGSVSYSFYLKHGLGIELTMNFYGNAVLGLGGPVYLVATLATSLVISLHGLTVHPALGVPLASAAILLMSAATIAVFRRSLVIASSLAPWTGNAENQIQSALGMSAMTSARDAAADQRH